MCTLRKFIYTYFHYETFVLLAQRMNSSSNKRSLHVAPNCLLVTCWQASSQMRKKSELLPEFTLTSGEGGADVATPLGASDRLQPDVVLGGAGELSHAVGGRCWTQHHFLVHANTLGHAHKNIV